jgi:hypothetical protein
MSPPYPADKQQLIIQPNSCRQKHNHHRAKEEQHQRASRIGSVTPCASDGNDITGPPRFAVVPGSCGRSSQPTREPWSCLAPFHSKAVSRWLTPVAWAPTGAHSIRPKAGPGSILFVSIHSLVACRDLEEGEACESAFGVVIAHALQNGLFCMYQLNRAEHSEAARNGGYRADARTMAATQCSQAASRRLRWSSRAHAGSLLCARLGAGLRLEGWRAGNRSAAVSSAAVRAASGSTLV